MGQRGADNPNWRGTEATVEAKHFRIITVRGKPTSCVWGCISAYYEWANLTGDYDDVWDFAAMCRSCHRRYDNARRTMEPGFTRHPWGIPGPFSADEVREIRSRARAGISGAALAREHGLSHQAMSRIINGKRYKWVLD